MNVYYGQIVALAQQRVKPKRIAQQLKVHPNTVYEQIRKARKIGVDIPSFAHQRKERDTQPDDGREANVPSAHNIAVPIRLHGLLVSEAERRGKTPTELAQAILEAALLEGWSRHG